MSDIRWRGIHAEIWVVSETRIHAEIEGKFQSGFFMDFPENFPAEFIRIFGDFIGDKQWRIFSGTLGNSLDKSWKIY